LQETRLVLSWCTTTSGMRVSEELSCLQRVAFQTVVRLGSCCVSHDKSRLTLRFKCVACLSFHTRWSCCYNGCLRPSYVLYRPFWQFFFSFCSRFL
jgi:hypothetical protein